MKMDINGASQTGKPAIDKLSGEFILAQEYKTVGYLLASMDDDANSVLDRLLDLPASEYDAVKAEVDKITNPSTPQKSEQHGADTSQAAS
jgi:hypothetical protein